MGADFKFSSESLEKRLGANAHPIQLPIGAESNFRGIVDLVTMEAFLYDENHKDEEGKIIPIPEDLKDDAELYRDSLINAVADFDEELMMAYLEGEEITVEMLKRAIRAATLSVQFFPILCGTAFKNKGVKKVLDAVIDYLPSPVEVQAIKAMGEDGEEIIIESEDGTPFTALAFKVMTDPFGKLTFFRVYSGCIQSGSYVLNATKGKKERIGRILQMHANNRTEITEVFAGDIAAAVGLKDTTTGDSLTDLKRPVILESMVFPEPVINVAIEPKTKNDEAKMSVALQKLAEEDPTFRTYTDEETGQTIIAGMGELHLEIIVDRMKREFRVECNVGRPQVSYRETISQEAKVEGKFVRQSGGHGQYGHAVVIFEPNPNKGFEFSNEIVGGVVPKEYIPAIQKGIENAMKNGNLAGFQTIDIKARLVFGSYHEVDSSAVAFEVAGGLAFKETAKACRPILLEPLMLVEVIVADEYVGAVIGDINSRRGRIEGTELRGRDQVVRAFVPLAEMFGYATALRSNTQGRGNYVMQFDHYEECPRSVTEEILKKRNA